MQPEPRVGLDRGASTVNESSAPGGVRPVESQPGAPAASAWATAPGVAGTGTADTGVTISGVILVVLGILVTLVGLLILFVGSAIGSLAPLGAAGADPQSAAAISGAFGSIIAGASVFVLVFGILQLVAGIGIFGRRSWARWLGIVMAAITFVFLLLGLLGSLGGGADPTGVVITIVILAAYGFCVYALGRGGRYFVRATAG